MARRKERDECRDVLCPMALDDSWKSKLDPECDDRQLSRTLTKKNILDFSNRKTKAFDEPFQKLVDGIKVYYGSGAGSKK